jgi:serine/threonine protein kinase
MVDYVEQLGNYRLMCLLGQGGFADVYLGEHIYLNTQAAIKVLQMHLGQQELEDFLNEARTVARLVHPHIVRVLEFGVENNTPFLVMDYAPNGTLRQRHPRGTRPPFNTIVRYVKQVAAALQYAHDKKLIHRDVKPENMLLGANDDILLSDFGIALVAQTSRSLQPEVLEAAGTLAYMAPEQLQGKPRPASDQYSLGIIVYEWISGERPFHGTFTEVASQHMFIPPAPLHENVPAIPPAVEQVVMTALAKDPHQRFASMQLFADALEQACLSAHLQEPLLPTMSTLANQPTQPISGGPSLRQFRQLPNPLPSQSKLSTSVTPVLDHPLVSLPGQALPSTQIAHSQVPTSDVASSPTLVLPTPKLPAASLPDSATLPLDHTLLPHTSVSPPDQSSQPTVMISSQSETQPAKKAISRRTVIMGLAGLASLTIVGSTVAFFVEHRHTPSHSRSSSPTAVPAETSTVQPGQTPSATPAQTPTVKPTQQPTATPGATSNPTPTPTPTAIPSPTPTPVPVVSSGTGTLHGTNSFNFDQGLEVTSGGDIYWDQQTDTVRTMDPVGNAQLANLGVVDFNSLDAAALRSQSYSTTPLNGNNDSTNELVNNDVFAVVTNGGDHAKVLVVSYGYDLQIQWTTYQG